MSSELGWSCLERFVRCSGGGKGNDSWWSEVICIVANAESNISIETTSHVRSCFFLNGQKEAPGRQG